MDKHRIDSHKLMFHIPRVNDWLEGQTIYPIYMEVSPVGACNHRCTFCGVDYMGYQNRTLKTEPFKERLTEMGQLGIKSIMYAGEGEPFLHPDLDGIIQHTKHSRIDAAITTNGTLMSHKRLGSILEHASWIKVSCNAGNKEDYAQIHKTKEKDFDQVIENVTKAVEQRNRQGLSCKIGMQMVLLPDNEDSVVQLAEISREIGVDYFVVKPYSQSLQSHNTKYKDISYEPYQYLDEELKQYNTDQFHVVFRAKTMKKWDKAQRSYQRCLALPFWSYIDAGGNVWGCSVYMNDDRFAYGNIFRQSYRDIWQDRKRCESLKWVENELDVSGCRVNCRMDEVNRYLWELKYPEEHVNFI